MAFKRNSIFQKLILLFPMAVLSIIFAIIIFRLPYFVEKTDIQNFIISYEPLALLIIFLSIIALAVYAARKVKIEKSLLIQIGIVFILALSLRMLVAPHTNRVYFDEDIYMDMARQIETSFKYCLCNFGNSSSCETCELMKWPAGQSFMMAIPFLIFGSGYEVAFSFAALLGSLACAVVFLLAYLLSGDKKIGLFAGIIMALTPVHILWSTSAASEPTMLLFMALAMLCIVIYSKSGKLSLFSLALMATAFAVYTKTEAILFIPIAMLGMFLLDEKFTERMMDRKYIISFALFLILISPAILHFSYSLKYETWGESGERISLNYIPQNMANVYYWLDYNNFNQYDWRGKQLYHPLLFTALALMGAYYLLKNKMKNIFLVIGAWFGVYFINYLIFYAGSITYGVDVRYVMTQSASFAVFAGFGLKMAQDYISKITPKNALPLALLLPLIVLLPLIPLIATPASQVEEASDARLYHDFAVNFAKNYSSDCYFISHVSSIYSVLGKGHVQIWHVYDNDFMEKMKGKCMIFDEGEWCAIKVGESRSCLEFNKFNMELLTQLNNTRQNKQYTFYRITPK